MSWKKAMDKFNKVVDWIHDEIIVERKAPGLLVGVSGTDSVVTFLACYEAFKRAGRPDRVMGVHFAPSEEFLSDHPEAQAHLWFEDEILPWLYTKAPEANQKIIDSIDWRYDGLRWGMLLEMSLTDIRYDDRKVLPPEKQYWVVGTRNRTENILGTYSNASLGASVLPIVGLYKSEILDICASLGVPPILLSKACNNDCLCGRQDFEAHLVREIDAFLEGNLLPPAVSKAVSSYVSKKLTEKRYKSEIPYTPSYLV